MRHTAWSVDCCEDPCAVAPGYSCFWPNINKHWCKLVRRHNQTVTKSPHLCRLAEPKCLTEKFQNPCMCPAYRRKTSMIQLEEPVRTRTEQLAYPQVSQLDHLRCKSSYSRFSIERKFRVNRLYRKSLLSLYSRLANVEAPITFPKSEPLSPKQILKHKAYIKQLAHPKGWKEKMKMQKELDLANTKQKPRLHYPQLANQEPKFKRTKTLAQPRKRTETEPFVWCLSEGARTFQPSARLYKLAQSKRREDQHYQPPSYVSPQSLTYKASKRISKLAMPAAFRTQPSTGVNTFAYSVSPNALKAKASKRLTELAAPRDFMDSHNRDNPFKVLRRALNAKLTPRLIELALPKQTPG